MARVIKNPIHTSHMGCYFCSARPEQLIVTVAMIAYPSCGWCFFNYQQNLKWFNSKALVEVEVIECSDECNLAKGHPGECLLLEL